MASWGVKPSNLAEALQVAQKEVSRAPVLIPVYSHRYIPSEPELVSNPVYSVYQTDIIYFGYDLAGYFHMEFNVPKPKWAAKSPRAIRFWEDLIEDNRPVVN